MGRTVGDMLNRRFQQTKVTRNRPLGVTANRCCGGCRRCSPLDSLDDIEILQSLEALRNAPFHSISSSGGEQHRRHHEAKTFRSLEVDGQLIFRRNLHRPALDLAGVENVDRAHLDSERRRHGLNDSKLADPGGYSSIAKHSRPGYARRNLPEQFGRFPGQAIFELPGRARLSTNPAPTGSATFANTVGTVRVAYSIGAMAEVPKTSMTSSARPTNSAAYLRILTASPNPLR